MGCVLVRILLRLCTTKATSKIILGYYMQQLIVMMMTMESVIDGNGKCHSLFVTDYVGKGSCTEEL